jgi:hypothetical protein
MARPAAAIAVALLALLLIHGVASLPDAASTVKARRLHASHHGDVASNGGHPHRHASRKLHQRTHPL